MKKHGWKIALGYTLLVLCVLAYFLMKLDTLPPNAANLIGWLVVGGGICGISLVFVGTMEREFKEHGGSWTQMRQNGIESGKRPVDKSVMRFLVIPGIIAGILSGVVYSVANGNLILSVAALFVFYKIAGWGLEKYAASQLKKDQSGITNESEQKTPPSIGI